MPALLRILVLIPVGYIAASISAGIFAMMSAYDFGGDPDFAMEGFVIGGGIVAGMYFGAFALAPAAVAIVFAEAYALRSFFFFAIIGGVIALGEVLIHRGVAFGAPEKLSVMIAAGVVAGAVYWVIAGRGSGRGIAARSAQTNGR